MALRTDAKARAQLADSHALSYRAAASTPAHGRFAPRSATARRAVQTFPELDCVRHRLSPATLSGIEQRAARLGVGADRVLLAAGVMSEEAYLRALAAALHVPFEPLDDITRDDCPLSDDDLILALKSGLLPIATQNGPSVVVVPRDLAARRFITSLRPGSDVHRRTRITSTDRLRSFVTRHAGGALGRQASDALRGRSPLLSAAPHRAPAAIWPIPALAALIIASVFAPGATIAAIQIVLTVLFLGWTALRLTGALMPCPPPPAVRGDDLLPTYTVIAALHREARVLPALVAALKALDYPRERLQIILALEHDDFETQFAAEFLHLDSRFEIVVVPGGGPRTKPKALNAALAFARGKYTVIYDAEDRPEPDQLRRALDAFRAGDKNLVCVQAALTIDNTRDGSLPRLFTVEYASQFDVLLPGFAALKLPILLGGSSNHFVTSELRKLGAWDPYNVTEDADLGMRIARAGFETATIPSTTYEEAPRKLRPWLRQRTRWFKGWMKTYMVHMRQPRRFAREVGLAGFAAFHFTLGGTVLAALVQPVLLLLVVTGLITIFDSGADGIEAVLSWAHGCALVSGYVTSIVLAIIGLKRRRLLSHAWVLVLMPLHWALLSVAASRALIQLAFDPYRWEKTEHGLARTSRRGSAASAIRDTAEGRPPPLRAVA